MGLIDSLRRRRLTQKGLSSGKKRRTQSDGPVVSTLDRSTALRYSIYGGFGVAVSSLVLSSMKEYAHGLEPFHGILSTLLVTAMAVVLFELSHQRVARRNGQILLVFGGLVAHLAVVRAVTIVVISNDLPDTFKLLLIPFAFAPMIHSVLLGPNLGLFSVGCTSVFGCFLVPQESMLPYLVMSMLCGLASVFVTREARKRGRLLRAGFYVGGIAVILACAFAVIAIRPLFDGGMVQWQAFGIQITTVFGVGILTGMIVSGLLPILESVFTLTTDISWLELSDLNHKLLRKMQLEAPGTFHHSMVVASLSEAAAESIGANAMVCRVCSYFHDIGKLNKPEYFIENQGESNPHDALTPTMSALIIIAHVKDGIDMAIKHKLNPRIIDVIREHHGDSLVYYFYRKAQEQLRLEEEKVNEGLENPEDLPDIDEKNFRYPGPSPRSRESGVISLSDAVESASRSLQKPTPKKIRDLVNEIVFNRIKDGQLDNCGLTVRELRTVRESFAKTLRSMLHSRIEYPKQGKPEEKGVKEPQKPSKETADQAKEPLPATAPAKGPDPSDKKGEAGKGNVPALGAGTGTAAKNVVPVEELEKHRRKASGDS